VVLNSALEKSAGYGLKGRLPSQRRMRPKEFAIEEEVGMRKEKGEGGKPSVSKRKCRKSRKVVQKRSIKSSSNRHFGLQT